MGTDGVSGHIVSLISLDGRYVSIVSGAELDTLYLHCIWSLNELTFP